MRSLFGKYWALLLSSVTLVIIVLTALLVQFFRLASGTVEWFFIFILDWMGALGVAAACLASTALVLTLRERRRRRPKPALNRLHSWATEVLVAINTFRDRDLSKGDQASRRHDDVRALIDDIKVNSRMALDDARFFGGELEYYTRRALDTLSAVDEKVRKSDDAAFEDLATLSDAFADLMVSAFKALHR